MRMLMPWRDGAETAAWCCMARGVRLLGIAAGVIVSFAFPARAAGEVFTHFEVTCGNIILLGASGYPGLQRRYTIRGDCALWSHWESVDTNGYASGKDWMGGFEATAVCRYDAKTRAVEEDSMIDGKLLQFRSACTADPFQTETGCDHPKIDGGGVDMRIVTALTKRNSPLFRLAVNPAEAEKLSALGGPKNPVPPPPTPLGPSLAPTKPPLRLPKAPEPAVGGQPVVPAAPAQAGQQPAGGSKASGKAVSNPAVPTSKPTSVRGGLGTLRMMPSPTPTPGRTRRG